MSDNHSTDGTETADSRETGVDFSRLDESLRKEAFPIDRETLLSEYGDVEIDIQGGEKTVESVFEEQASGGGDREYESVGAVHQAVLNMVGSEAVGREEYSDRGGSSRDEGDGNGETGEESL